MTTYSCLLIDDNVIDVEYLQNQLRQLSMITVHTICRSVEEATQQLSGNRYDLIFLDIKLPGQSGLDWVQTLPYHPSIIVTTAHPAYAADSYDLNIVDYLVKPFNLRRLNRAVNRALVGRFNQSPSVDKQLFFLHVNRQLQRFDFKDIKFLEASGPSTKLVTQDGVAMTNESISILEERLPVHQFLRIHKSFIINLDKLTKLDYRTVWLDDTKVPIGSNYRETVLKLLNWKNRQKSTSSLVE